ncbi:DALR anticodon-binding domain-containing protein [Streptomyces sp. NBC_01723]|uniref:ArgS-related anticodon-binding protein NrtL n=1 Tax=Streptomyces sp. NBC_01723 TaxID=2975921 RepID=UPI002E38242E|nr:DALR anticodon-binding domain-containing protein [Streptomyces sp. NBC_01723]
MTPVELSRTVLRAVRRAVDGGELDVDVPVRVRVGPPGPGGCGDYATGIALQLARPAGQPPYRVAEVLRTHLTGADGIADVVLTGPGFLNISLHRTAPAELVAEVLRRGPRYGHLDPEGGEGGEGERRRVQLHCDHHPRALVVADAAARILRSQGALARVGCAAPPEPEWTAVLGVRVDAEGPARDELTVQVRPVPAPGDPLPLGRDAGRWALLHPAAHDRPRIGDEHLVQRESNPLFRVRYAHARTRALARNAADLGFAAEPGPTEDANGNGNGTDKEGTSGRELYPLLGDHPRLLAAAAAHHAPDRLARHLVTVADAVLPFLPAVLPRGGEKPSAAHRARLALAEAAGTVLAGGLTLLGIDAPDHL